MRDEQAPTDGTLDALHAKLAAMRPSAAIDRDALMFAAGQKGGAAQLRTARRLLAGAGTACLALAGLLLASVTQGLPPMMHRNVTPDIAQHDSPAPPQAERFPRIEISANPRSIGPSLSDSDRSSLLSLSRIADHSMAREDNAIPHDARPAAPIEETGPAPNSARALLKQFISETSSQM